MQAHGEGLRRLRFVAQTYARMRLRPDEEVIRLADHPTLRPLLLGVFSGEVFDAPAEWFTPDMRRSLLAPASTQAHGVRLQGTVTCPFDSVEAGTYALIVIVDGGFYTGTHERSVTVTAGGTSFFSEPRGSSLKRYRGRRPVKQKKHVNFLSEPRGSSLKRYRGRVDGTYQKLSYLL